MMKNVKFLAMLMAIAFCFQACIPEDKPAGGNGNQDEPGYDVSGTIAEQYYVD